MTTASTSSRRSRAAFTRWLMLGVVGSATAALLTGCYGSSSRSTVGSAYSPVSVSSEYASLDAAAPAADTSASSIDVTPSRDRLAGIPLADAGVRPAVLAERPAYSAEPEGSDTNNAFSNAERDDAVAIVANQPSTTIPDVDSAAELAAIVRPEGAPAMRQFMENIHGEVSVGVNSRGESGTAVWTGSQVEVAPNFTVGVGIGIAARN